MIVNVLRRERPTVRSAPKAMAPLSAAPASKKQFFFCVFVCKTFLICNFDFRIIRFPRCFASGVTRVASAWSASAAKTTSEPTTWTPAAERTTAPTSAATTATASAVPASAGSGPILQRFTAASTANVTTSTATVSTTSSAEVRTVVHLCRH